MPELPEVEVIRQRLAERFKRYRFGPANLLRGDIVRNMKRPNGRHLLSERSINAVHRYGKHLALEADDGRVLAIHLGMSGEFFFHRDHAPAADIKHVHCWWPLHNHTSRKSHRACLVFRDPRRFGGLRCYADMNGVRKSLWAPLGPDALTVSPDQLAARCRSSQSSIKSLLLDQRRIAGVGNIYADEALFLARISPCTPGCDLAADDWKRLTAALLEVLLAAIELGGSTVRSFKDADGRPGRFGSAHRVYGRGGQPCFICEKVLHTDIIAGRTTVFCAKCQR